MSTSGTFGSRSWIVSVAALQPMTNETRDVWVVFNGEIYNHAELRTVLRGRGHQFRTHHSDTEVLVHGFEEWGGRGLLDRLRGMFAFAILDLRNRQLLLARDPFGEKPMYVANDGRGIAFASELKAVLRTEFVGQQLSEPGLGDYLRFGYVPAPGCILKHVWKLRAAEMATIRPGSSGEVPQGVLLATDRLHACRRGARKVACRVRRTAVARRAAEADE